MPYITIIGLLPIFWTSKFGGIPLGRKDWYRKGIREGLLKAIKLGLELKFGTEGLKIYPEIKKINDVDVLEAISEAIKSAKNIEEIKEIYKGIK